MRSPWFIVFWPIVSFLLLQSASAIQNLRSIGAEWNSFESWLYEDKHWTGTWLPNPEGYVDGEEMGVDYGSGIEPRLMLNAERGELGGTISTVGICKVFEAFPLIDFLNVSGNASMTGDTAVLDVWDYVGGRRRVYRKIELKRDGIRMDYKLLVGGENLLPKNARIWLDPASMPPPPELAGNIPALERSSFCREELKAYRERLSADMPSP